MYDPMKQRESDVLDETLILLLMMVIVLASLLTESVQDVILLNRFNVRTHFSKRYRVTYSIILRFTRNA